MTKFINYVSPGYINVPSRYCYKLLRGTFEAPSRYPANYITANGRVTNGRVYSNFLARDLRNHIHVYFRFA